MPFLNTKSLNNVLVIHRQIFIITHILLPALVLGALFIALEETNLDIWLSNHFYNSGTHQWPLKDHWLIQKVLHKGGRYVFFSIIAVFLACFLWSFKTNTFLKKYRLNFGYLFLVSICGPIMIMYLKNHTHIYCPWDLQLFGGVKPYIRWFDEVPSTAPVGHCFPAAHAGSGFAFVSLYFFCLMTRISYRYYGLGFGLILGVLYGVTQQMRGAHFLSHDITALAICWFTALALFMIFFRKKLQWTANSEIEAYA